MILVASCGHVCDAVWDDLVVFDLDSGNDDDHNDDEEEDHHDHDKRSGTERAQHTDAAIGNVLSAFRNI